MGWLDDLDVIGEQETKIVTDWIGTDKEPALRWESTAENAEACGEKNVDFSSLPLRPLRLRVMLLLLKSCITQRRRDFGVVA
jgi:hypothetical protein